MIGDIGGGLVRAWIQGMVILAAVSFITGATVVWGLPKLWVWFKPILQGWLS
jgi:hypothetical protein